MMDDVRGPRRVHFVAHAMKPVIEKIHAEENDHPGGASTLAPALQSWWIWVHIIGASTGFASVLIAAGLGLLYLLKEKYSGGPKLVAGLKSFMLLFPFPPIFRARVE